MLCSRVGAAFYGSTAECPQYPSTTGAGTAPGRNLECTRGPQSGSGPHRKLGRESLGSTAGRSMCGASWSGGRNRTALGRKLLVALPRALSAPARLPRTGAAFRKSFRPTASRTCGTNTETQKPKQTQIPCACRAPLEETMEADNSIWRKTGHFYFALTEWRLWKLRRFGPKFWMQFIGLRKGIMDLEGWRSVMPAMFVARGNNSPRERACPRECDVLDPEAWLRPETNPIGGVQQ